MKPSVAAFYVSCLFAFVTGHIVNYAVIIYAQDVLNSDLLSGIGFGLCFGPAIVFGWYAGVLCDRLAPGRIIVTSQLVFMLAGALLLASSILAAGAVAKAGLLVAAAFCAGCGWSFVAPARFATLAQIVPLERLHGATVLLNLLTMLGFGVAPIIIAVIHRQWNWDGVFTAIIVGFATATILMAWTPTQGSGIPRRHAMADVREGLRAVTAKPLLLQLLLANILAYCLMGPMQVLLPRLASSQLLLGGIERGAYLGTLAAALIVGGVLCMVLRRRMHDGRTILTGALAGGLSIIVIANIVAPLPSALVLFVSGTVGGIVVSLIVAGLQSEADPAVRGRVMSMYTISSQVVPALSGLVAGVLSEFLGVVTAMLVCGTLIALAALAALLRLSAVRAYNRAAS